MFLEVKEPASLVIHKIERTKSFDIFNQCICISMKSQFLFFAPDFLPKTANFAAIASHSHIFSLAH